MAYCKNQIQIVMNLLSRTVSCPLSSPRTHILLISLLLFSLLFISSSLTECYSPSSIASTFASRLILVANYISPFSSVSSSNTCLVSNSETNCTFPTVRAAQRGGGGGGGTHENTNTTKQRKNYMMKELASCDIFDGNWVVDDSDSGSASASGSGLVYKPGSCPFVDNGFNCFNNGRPDMGFLRYKWKPHGCRIPRFNGRKMLGILRGKRMVFVGDSLNRNMWESLICSLRSSLKDKSRIYEVSGKSEFKTQGFYSFKFRDYKCSIDFIKSPFLVQEWKTSDEGIGIRRETLRLDMIHQGSSSVFHDADIIIFNTGHWWTHHKTNQGKNYFQEGSHIYDTLEVAEAYTKALRTWAQWVDANVDGNRTRVFFIGYSSSHFRKGQWNSGGHCDGEIEPITNETHIAAYPWMMSIFESVIAEMKTPVFYLNITKMTGYRKDGHPSIYRQPKMDQKNPLLIQDCSHWCLPGVPDTWNQLLYATLLISKHALSNK